MDSWFASLHAIQSAPGINFPQMPKEKVAQILREGYRHLHFVIALYKIQLDKAAIFSTNILLGPQAGEMYK